MVNMMPNCWQTHLIQIQIIPPGSPAHKIHRMRKLNFKVGASITVKDNDQIDKYFNELNRIPLISREEEMELIAKAKQGDKAAQDKVITANLRFVISVANKYKRADIQLADLIGEGNRALMKALNRYDLSNGAKFISYAVWWIRQFMLQFCAEYSIVKRSMGMYGDLGKLRKIQSSYYTEFGYYPSIEEIADAMDLPVKKVNKLMEGHHELSIDSPTSSTLEDVSWLDILPANHKTDEGLMQNDLKTAILDAIDKLKPRHAFVIKEYYGIDTDYPRTLENIAQELKVSREMVRHIKKGAIKKLYKLLESYAIG